MATTKTISGIIGACLTPFDVNGTAVAVCLVEGEPHAFMGWPDPDPGDGLAALLVGMLSLKGKL